MKAIITTLDGEKEIEGEMTTDHATSSYGQPVFVDEEGQSYDSWQIKELIRDAIEKA